MKKFLVILFVFVLTTGGILLTTKVTHASTPQVEQGYLSTGTGKSGQAAYYSARKQGDRGFTRADLKAHGGATVWVHAGTIATRKTQTGTYNQKSFVEAWQYGQTFEHHYLGVWPAY